MELEVLKWIALIVASLAAMRVLRVLAYSVLAPWAEKRAAYKAAMAAAKVADTTERRRAKQARREQRREAARQRQGERTARRAKARVALGKGTVWVLELVGGMTLAAWRAASATARDLTRYLRVWMRVHHLSRAERSEVRAEVKAWRRVAKGGKVKATRRPRWHQALGRQLRPVCRAVYRGDVLRVAAVYRVLDQGEWHAAILVQEPQAGQSYWLAGDPQEDPRLEGLLVDRRAVPHLAA